MATQARKDNLRSRLELGERSPSDLFPVAICMLLERRSPFTSAKTQDLLFWRNLTAEKR
jgi:hypothetical protein